MGRVPDPGEPRWTERDRTIAQAWLEHLDTVCPLCGNPKELCHDRDLDGEIYGEVVTCHITAAIARTRKREWDRFTAQGSEDVEVATDGAYVTVKHRQASAQDG